MKKTMQALLSTAAFATIAPLHADVFDEFFKNFGTHFDDSLLEGAFGLSVTEDDVLIGSTTHHRYIFQLPEHATKDDVSVEADHRSDMINVTLELKYEESEKAHSDSSVSQSFSSRTSTTTHRVSGAQLDLTKIQASFSAKNHTLTISAPYTAKEQHKRSAQVPVEDSQE